MLIHRPERKWRQDPNILHDKSYSNDTPTFSIVMPIHNQEATIERVLTNVLVNTVGYYEIILILDGCEDNTKSVVLNWLNQPFPSIITRIRVIENIEGIFEASCDNQGFVMSDGKYVIEIQADMQIMTLGYNIILATPLEIYDDIIGISGRCCHGINDNSHYIADGKIGDLIDKPHSINFSHFNTVTLSHSANRGPLVLKKSMLHDLGYLDEAHYPMDASDHDLFMRAWRDRTWRCGFVPIEFYSPQSWGSTRKVRNDVKSRYLYMRESKMKYGYFNQNSTTFKYPDAEIRTMNWGLIGNTREILMKRQ
jgi:glycosyltransferase involved in cell wall biosynthesis